MISPHGGDNMLARFQAGVICLSTYFTGKIFVCQLFVSFERRVAPCSDIRQNEATNKGFYLNTRKEKLEQPIPSAGWLS